MTLSGANLDECVTFHLIAEFLKEKHDWFSRVVTSEHPIFEKNVSVVHLNWNITDLELFIFLRHIVHCS